MAKALQVHHPLGPFWVADEEVQDPYSMDKEQL